MHYPVRFALLGTGYWAENCHGAGLAAHPDVEFVGVWGRDAEESRAVADRFGIAAESDLDTLLGRVDAVAIAVPPDVQAELACRAAAAGCHLLLEKPLALSVAAADRVVAAINAAGVSSVVLFSFRFKRPISNWLDNLVLEKEWHGGSATLLAPPPSADSPSAKSPWRQKWGGLWDVGPHLLSVLLPPLGRVREVLARHADNGTANIILTHESGKLSNMTLNFKMPDDSKRFEIAFWGTSGIVTNPPIVTGLENAARDLAMAGISALLDSVASGAPHPCHAAFAAQIVRILADATRAPGR
jgi:predicted dehydrogenase